MVMADTPLDEVRKSAARDAAVLRERLTDAIDDVLDDRDDELADRLVEAALAVFDDAAIERMAQYYVDDTHVRSMEFRNGAELELVPAQDMVAVWVATARTMLGDAPNYSETRVDFPAEKVEMELKLAGEVDRYVFTVQRAGKLTPHEARVKAEQERDETRAEIGRMRDLLGAVWVYADWKRLTEKLTVERSELWADVVDAVVGPGMVSPGETPRPVAVRWWRDDFAPATDAAS